MIQNIFMKLKEAMEQHSRILKSGRAFLPEGLEGKALTREVFPKIVGTLASKLKLDLRKEVRNYMPGNYYKDYGVEYQIIDFVFKMDDKDMIFFELESLDRSQIYLFRDYNDMDPDWDDNKLRYYKGTLERRIAKGIHLPRYYISLLILPDQAVGNYTIWDFNKHYNFLHKSLRQVIYQNPYRFYDGMIKSSARLWLEERLDYTGDTLRELQNKCELVFITCTIENLILSRGRDLFNPKKEIVKAIEWE